MPKNGPLFHICINYNLYNLKFREFLLENFGNLNHVFVFRLKKSEKHNLTAGKTIYAHNFVKLIKLIPQFLTSKRIYIHYLPNGPSILFWALMFPLHKKIVWVYWGGDIYLYQAPRKKLMPKVYEFCRRVIIKRIKYIAGFLPGDFDLIKQWYKTKANYIPIIYPLPANIELSGPPQHNTIKQILIGNSADPSNNHLEALLLLEKYKNENIKIICPLSYGGNKEYIEQVIKMGITIFGDKFTPLTQLLPSLEYHKILSETNIAIMCHNRQQGLGNILPLLTNSCKVYVNPQITTYAYFTNLEIKIFSAQDIVKSDYEGFIDFEELWGKKNAEIIKAHFSNSTFINLWTKALSL